MEAQYELIDCCMIPKKKSCMIFLHFWSMIFYFYFFQFVKYRASNLDHPILIGSRDTCIYNPWLHTIWIQIEADSHISSNLFEFCMYVVITINMGVWFSSYNPGFTNSGRWDLLMQTAMQISVSASRYCTGYSHLLKDVMGLTTTRRVHL